MREPKNRPHMNVGTIGHVDHGKTALTAAIIKLQQMQHKPANCQAPNGAGHTTADCPGEECRRTGQCQVA